MAAQQTEATPLLESIGLESRTTGGALNTSNRKIEKNFKNRLHSPVVVYSPSGSIGYIPGAQNYDLAGEGKLSFWASVYTIVNVFLGLGLLSLPYAVMKGSIWAVIGLAFVSSLGCLTGYFLVKVASTLDV